MNDKLPVNINELIKKTVIEDERIEFKSSWNPEAALHTVCAFANDFHNLDGGYRNLRVGEFLKDLELIEGCSTGISTIIDEMKKNGSPPAVC